MFLGDKTCLFILEKKSVLKRKRVDKKVKKREMCVFSCSCYFRLPLLEWVICRGITGFRFFVVFSIYEGSVEFNHTFLRKKNELRPYRLGTPQIIVVFFRVYSVYSVNTKIN